MPQRWRINLYKRKRQGASPEQLQNEFGMPAEEIAKHIEAARLCFERQWLVASFHERSEVKARAI